VHTVQCVLTKSDGAFPSLFPLSLSFLSFCSRDGIPSYLLLDLTGLFWWLPQTSFSNSAVFPPCLTPHCQHACAISVQASPTSITIFFFLSGGLSSSRFDPRPLTRHHASFSFRLPNFFPPCFYLDSSSSSVCTTSILPRFFP